MKNLTKENLLKILKEEIDNIIFEDDVNSEVSFVKDYSNLSQSLLDYSSKLDPAIKNEMDYEISSALKRGNTAIDYNLYSKDSKAFVYFTDALATIIKNELEGSENAKRALMMVFSPFSKRSSTTKNSKGEPEVSKQKMSDFFLRVNRFAASHIDLKGEDAIYFVNDMNTDNLLDAFYKGFDNAIKYFNPELKKSFNSLLSIAIANAKIDIWRKQNTYVNKGEKIIKKTDSLDQPLDSDDMDSGTLGDTISSDELSTDRLLEKNRARKIWNAINEFIKRAINFNFPDNPKYEQIYEMYTLHDMDIEEIAKALDLESGNIRIMKMRAEDAVQPFISDGTLSQFVMQATGEKIKDIPFIKGKGSSKMRFVFPRVKDSLKEGAEKVFSNILILKENEFVFDSTSFYKESENPDWIEYSQFILNESENKISFITKIYNQFNEINTMLNEDYDGNYNVDVVDLFEQVKQFVEESNRIISALYDEVHKLDNVAYSVQGEYPSISETISSSISPIVEKLEEWPNKLNFMLRSVRQKYNPTNAYGL